MIYAESLRHFVQEWIIVKHPRAADRLGWPWRTDSSMFLINLYAVSSDDSFLQAPTPFVSILVNGIDDEDPPIITTDQIVYKPYFREAFKFPRKYFLDLEARVNSQEKNFKTNRYTGSSNSYIDVANDWNSEDMRLLRILASRKHVRYTPYDSWEYELLRQRLSIHNSGEFHVQIADNIFDCTDDYPNAYYQTYRNTNEHALMLIQAPISGLLRPIKKSKDYKIINGALIIGQDTVQMSLASEPSYKNYSELVAPFGALSRFTSVQGLSQSNQTKTVVYLAVEAPCGVFTFQEYQPGQTVKSSSRTYARLLSHSFVVQPEQNGADIEVRLRHNILEGLIHVGRETRTLLSKQSTKLFHRSDMPDGFVKSKGGDTVTVKTNPSIPE